MVQADFIRGTTGGAGRHTVYYIGASGELEKPHVTYRTVIKLSVFDKILSEMSFSKHNGSLTASTNDRVLQLIGG